MMEEEWINRLKKKLEGYREEPPAGMLEEIKQQMHDRGIGTEEAPAKGGNRLWLPWMGYAAAAVVAGFLLMTPLTKRNESADELAVLNELPEGEQTAQLQTSQSAQAQTSQSAQLQTSQSAQAQATQKSTIQKSNTKKSTKQKSTIQESTKQKSSNSESSYSESSNSESSNSESSNPESTNPVDQVKASPTQADKLLAEAERSEMPATTGVTEMPAAQTDTESGSSPQKRHSVGRLLSEVFFGNLLSNEQRGNGRMLLAEASPLGEYKESLGGGQSPQAMAGSGEMKTKAKHKQPVQWGASVRLGLAPRWTLQTGLTYTYLSSDITREQGAMRYETNQGLHFIGIPVAVSYEVWSHGKWRVYVSGGGQVERMVKGKAETECFIKGERQATTHERIKDHRLQFSANVSAGIAYRLLPWLSAYAEPGASYYFDNGSAVKSRYTDQPWNANFRFGFRLQLGE